MATVAVAAPGGSRSKTRDTSPGGISEAGMQALDSGHLGGAGIGTDDYTFNKPVFVKANAAITLEVCPWGNSDDTQSETLVLAAGERSLFAIKKIFAAGSTAGANFLVVW